MLLRSMEGHQTGSLPNSQAEVFLKFEAQEEDGKQTLLFAMRNIQNLHPFGDSFHFW